MPTGRKERPAMTKPREKIREELTAEIEQGKKKIQQYENREKMLRQKLSREERRTRSHRLIVQGAIFESIVPGAKTMTDEEAADLLRLALTSEDAAHIDLQCRTAKADDSIQQSTPTFVVWKNPSSRAA